MPYIKNNIRDELHYRTAKNAGELNFLITQLIKEYALKSELNYQAINDVLGALEGAKLEFYRRVASSYENKKIRENGDVYDDGQTHKDSESTKNNSVICTSSSNYDIWTG